MLQKLLFYVSHKAMMHPEASGILLIAGAAILAYSLLDDDKKEESEGRSRSVK